MTTYQEFMDSLPTDLNPEDRAEKALEFAKTRDEEFRTLQSSTTKGVEQLKAEQENLLMEAKKVADNPNYLLELNEKDPKKAETILKTFGQPGMTMEQVKAGAKAMPAQQDVRSQIEAYNKEQEASNYVTTFINSMGFTEEEKKVFEKDLETIRGGRSLSTKELKSVMTGIAFDMGKNLSNSKERIMGQNNIIPQGQPGGRQIVTGEYKPHDSSTQEFMQSAGIIRSKPQGK